MVRKLFIYTGIVIWHFEQAKKKKKKKKTWNFNICNYFCGKNAILGYISLWKWNSAKKRLLYPQNIINHNFVKYPHSMVWKLDVYINITITYFCKPKTW